MFSVRSGGATGIQVRSFTDSKCSTFRTEDQDPIISIKLSPDQRILGQFIQNYLIKIEAIAWIYTLRKTKIQLQSEFFSCSKDKDKCTIS